MAHVTDQYNTNYDDILANDFLVQNHACVATQYQPPRMAVTTLMRTHRRPTALALMSSAPIGRLGFYIRLVKADLTNADSRK
jgi:hypothetical protein